MSRRSWPRLLLLAPLALPAAGCIEQSFHKHEGDDVFYQLEAGEVDVLLVIDNSGSMQPYQDKLAENFDAFLTYFIEGDVEYHIGVVTTAVAESVALPDYGCTQADVDAIPPAGHLAGGTFITPETADGDALFRELVGVGVCGSGYEMGIESAYRAVTEPARSSANAGFLRDDAYLSIIFVSDEQDASPKPVNAYINAFNEVKGQRHREIVNASALVVTDPAACGALAYSTSGSRYIDVAEQTGGVVGDICAEDFGDIVQELSLASSRLTDTFYLSKLPEAASLIVGVDDEEIPCDAGEWTYQLLAVDGEERGAIVFDRAHMPPPQSRITVRYDLGDGDPDGFCSSEDSE